MSAQSPVLDLSIVLPTCNRAELLLGSLMAIHHHTHCEYEVVVVDGASEDATGEVLQLARSVMGGRLRVIREEKREGFVRAVNKGFRACRGDFVTWINDDARPMDGCYDRAIGLIESRPMHPGVVLALFHRWSGAKNVAGTFRLDERDYQVCHVRGTRYANFGFARREVFEKLDYFDERFYMCGADPDFSLKAWDAGMLVLPAPGCCIDHDEVADDRRAEDSERAANDNRRLFEKWQLPAKSEVNDFDMDRPCTLPGHGPVMRSVGRTRAA